MTTNIKTETTIEMRTLDAQDLDQVAGGIRLCDPLKKGPRVFIDCFSPFPRRPGDCGTFPFPRGLLFMPR